MKKIQESEKKRVLLNSIGPLIGLPCLGEVAITKRYRFSFALLAIPIVLLLMGLHQWAWSNATSWPPVILLLALFLGSLAAYPIVAVIPFFRDGYHWLRDTNRKPLTNAESVLGIALAIVFLAWLPVAWIWGLKVVNFYNYGIPAWITHVGLSLMVLMFFLVSLLGREWMSERRSSQRVVLLGAVLPFIGLHGMLYFDEKKWARGIAFLLVGVAIIVGTVLAYTREFPGSWGDYTRVYLFIVLPITYVTLWIWPIIEKGRATDSFESPHNKVDTMPVDRVE